MKFVIIITGGRSGSDLLQSLFDGHPQILQFPGQFIFDKSFIDILDETDPQKISQVFCNLNKKFFDSRIQKVERHHMLGKNKMIFIW
tara:strand:+ start:1309 stop:1569 length:261 start_codon:yes stop_codon:yes gene_type:complete